MTDRSELIREELQEKPRVPDSHITHNKNYNPSTYLSIQYRVNADQDFEKTYILKLITEGWVRLEKIESILDEELKGRHFKYRLNGTGLSGAEKGTFRSGGILVGMKDDDKDYILYKAYNGCIFPLQLSDIKEIYIKDPKKEIVKFNKIKNPTQYPVYLQNSNNEPEIVFYAINESQRNKFIESANYKKVLSGKKWIFIEKPNEDKKYDQKKIVNFTRPEIKTKYPVYLIYPITGKKVAVYYGKDNNQRDRFISSSKFEHAYATNNWSFE
jgi:hypothetical protein